MSISSNLCCCQVTKNGYYHGLAKWKKMGSLFYGGIKGKMVRTIVEVLLLEVFIALGIHNRAQKLCQMVTNWTEIYLFIYLF